MKILKLKYIISSLIIIFIGVLAGLYFIGGLEYRTITYDNIEFNEDDFIDFNSIRYDENGNKYKVELEFDKNKLVAENDKYKLVFDEETTIAKILDKETDEVLFQTAEDTKDSRAANLLLEYAKVSNGKLVNNLLNTYNNSVNFINTLTEDEESHYKIKYIEDGVQILYEVGRFSANLDYFPMYYHVADFAAETMEDFNGDRVAFKRNLQTLEGRLRGNTFFTYTLEPDPANNRLILQYDNQGYTYSPAAAQYLSENNLAIVNQEPGTTTFSFTVIDPSLYDSFGTHLNSPTSPVYTNPFIGRFEFTTFKNYYLRQIANENFDFPHYERKLTNGSQQTFAYDILYRVHQETDISSKSIPVYDLNGEPVMRGGFHAVDENGNFLYEDGKPVRELYTLKKVAEDNALFNVVTATSLERFKVCLQLKLTDNGLEATILGDSLQDYDARKKDKNYDHDYLLSAITVLPEFTSSKSLEDEGIIVIPDGSGAIINFNNNKGSLNYAAYNKQIYGRDMAFVLDMKPEDVQTLMFNMYGFINNTQNKGILAIVEKGAGQTNIFADTPRLGNQRNVAYFRTRVRQMEMVTAGTGYNASEFPKWSKNMSKTDLVYNYIILDESRLNYVGLANEYRDYLINKYNLVEKDTTQENVVDINFLGAFERYDLFLGIKYMRADSLTTFSEAQAIVKELLTKNVNELSIDYSFWTKDEIEVEYRKNLKVSSQLGKKDGMIDFAEYLKSQGIDFYPQVNVGSSKGYDYPFGNIKYTTKGVGNAYAKHYPYNLATLMEDKTMNPTYYIAPQYYYSLINKMLPSYNKLGIDNIYVPDLGNTMVGNYKKHSEVYGYGAQLYQQDALNLLDTSINNIKLSAPFDYAIPYVDFAVDVPLQASQYGIFDQTIPFYQLVVNGLFDYTTDYVNGISDKSVEWYFANALTTGCNIRFLISYTDPILLLDTDYTQYYKSYYQNWKNVIIDLNNRINEAGIHRGRLSNYEIITRDVVKVTYDVKDDEDIVLVVNTSNKEVTYNGENISPYGYLKLGGN